jgi:hypothetical protein
MGDERRETNVLSFHGWEHVRHRTEKNREAEWVHTITSQRFTLQFDIEPHSQHGGKKHGKNHKMSHCHDKTIGQLGRGK